MMLNTCKAAFTAAPEEIPTNIPSFVAKALAVAIASSDDTRMISFIRFTWQLSGTNPAPIP